MSLTDKVIKNTYYFFLSQVSNFILPLFLTPFLVSKLGNIQFGIYAIVLGFTGTFGLLDLSLSSSFLKFISEHYNKGEEEELNFTINTGLFFYILVSLVLCGVGFLFSENFISLFNIPAELKQLSVNAFRISIIVFFISNSFGIFNSVLVSLQKMYITSIVSIVSNILIFTLTILIVLYGYGLLGILVALLFVTFVNTILSVYYAKKELPQIRISLKNIRKNTFTKMLKIGLPMQFAKISTFAGEKYDEFLLGTLSILSNVTYFNMANRVSRYARLFPMQIFQQGAPVAAELNAKEQKDKLIQLLNDTTKYMSILTAPIFFFIFFFSDAIIITWLGAGYDISVHILRILAISQLVNMIFSAPGNSIIPNMGKPKYQMNESLIFLFLNIPLSYILIRTYGVVGAAYGATISIIISSLYVYFTSIKFFSQNNFGFLRKNIIKPNIIAFICSLLIFLVYKFFSLNVYPISDRKSGIIYLLITGLLFLTSYLTFVLRSKDFNERDRLVFKKIIYKLLPVRYFKPDTVASN